MAERLVKRGFILDLVGENDIDGAQLQQAMAKADLAAATVCSGVDEQRIEFLSISVQRIDLDNDSVSIALSPHGVNETLGTAAPLLFDGPALVISIAAGRMRRGKQMRLVVLGPEQESQPPLVRRDNRLIALIAEALQARELVLAHPERSIASVAAQHGRCRTRLAKLVGLSCLAPDIVTAILEGRQPEALTAHTLSAAILPTEWAQQRSVLGFG